MKKTALIMAGGCGERFWPRSRKKVPKQFLTLTDNKKTMIQLTVERILPLVDIEDIYVVTNKIYKELVKQQLPDLPENNILCEPVGRNTAPCIGWGAIYISKKYDDAIMFVLPSDHLVKCNNIFIDTLEKASSIAKQNTNLVTVGITPNYPETEYGYIKFHFLDRKESVFLVEKFVEKPSLEVARQYLDSKQYLWNSGIYIWKVSSILKNMEVFMKETYDGLMNIKESIGTRQEQQILEKEFFNFPSESIDYGIMEKANNLYTIPGNFGWDDVGSWLATERIQKVDELDNVINGNIVTINCDNCIIEGSEKLIAAIGLENVVVVDSSDALLLCKKESVRDIKKVIEYLKVHNMEEYL